jgi:hypothetical protein
MPSTDKVTNPAKHLGGHLAGLVTEAGKLAVGVASFLKDEASQLAGLKSDIEADATAVAVFLADGQSGNLFGAAQAAETLVADAQKTVTDAKVVQAAAVAAEAAALAPAAVATATATTSTPAS